MVMEGGGMVLFRWIVVGLFDFEVIYYYRDYRDYR